MSRRFPRIRARLTATLTVEGSDGVLVCHTRDISERGCFLSLGQDLELGTHVVVAVMDEARGIAMEIQGHVARSLPAGPDGTGRGIGVRFEHPPAEWDELVAIYRQQQSEQPSAPPRRRRLRILVVGDRARQRGAMALYVTSGWDVRFATDLDSAHDALSGVRLHAVIAEGDMRDTRWQDVLSEARRMQPHARRIVRSHSDQVAAPVPGDEEALYHQVVDRDAGLDALLEALLHA